MTDVSRILDALGQGDPHAAEQLLPLVYAELRRLAAANLAHEPPGQTLDATGLVHEAYLRLIGRSRDREGAGAAPLPHGRGSEPQFAGRGHFFAAAAEAMRRILVDRARRKRSQKRGGGGRRALDVAQLAAPEDTDEVLAVDEALDRLAAADPQAAQLVKLRYFAGLPLSQVSAIMNVSPRTADRMWAYARAWLRDALGSD